MEDVDFNYSLKRDDYEKIIAPVLEQFQQLLDQLVQQLANLKVQLHSVEIVGGATRVPII